MGVRSRRPGMHRRDIFGSGIPAAASQLNESETTELWDALLDMGALRDEMGSVESIGAFWY